MKMKKEEEKKKLSHASIYTESCVNVVSLFRLPTCIINKLIWERKTKIKKKCIKKKEFIFINVKW